MKQKSVFFVTLLAALFFPAVLISTSAVVYHDKWNSIQIDGITYKYIDGEDGCCIFGHSNNSEMNIPATVKMTRWRMKDYDVASYVESIQTVPVIKIGTQDHDVWGKVRILAFQNIESTMHVSLPSTIKSIVSYAFENSTGLESIKLNWGLRAIGTGTFSGCTNLSSVNFPMTLHAIPEKAFYNCSSLPSISITFITSISRSAFEGCTSLTSVSGANRLTMVQTIGERAFYGCIQLQNIDFAPNQLVNIGPSAFENCETLTTITLPESLTSIGDFAFKNTNLKKITNNKTLPQPIKANVFEGVKLSQCVLYVPKGSKAAYKKADVWKNFGNILEPGEQPVDVEEEEEVLPIETGLQKIGDLTYELHEDLTATLLKDDNNKNLSGVLVIPTSVKYGGYSYTVTAVGSGVFADCSKLTSVALPNTITELPSQAFYSCKGLKTVVLPTVLEKIGASAFNGCEALQNCILPTTLTEIEECAFLNCKSLTSVSIPAGIETIRNCCFESCEKLSSVRLSEGLTKIENCAFIHCNALNSITLPTSLTTVEANAFRDVQSLSYVYPLSETPPEAEFYSFFDVSPACILYVPVGSLNAYKAANGWKEFKDIREKGVNEIIKYGNLYYRLSENGTAVVTYESNNTENYSTLTGEVTVVDKLEYRGMEYTVQGVGLYAFRYATAITKVNLPNTINEISGKAFYGCTNLEQINIPVSLYQLSDDAFKNTKLFDNNKDKDGAVYYDGCLLAMTKQVSGAYTVKEGTRLIANWAINAQEGITSLVLPEGLICLCKESVNNLENMTSITLPSTLTYIGGAILNNCGSLKDIYNYAEKPYFLINIDAFNGLDKSKCTLYVPKGSKDEYSTAIHWKDFPILEMEPQTFTVTFVYWNGDVLKTEEVEKDGYATAPPTPYRPGYDFKGWDKTFNEVTEDLTVTTQYEKRKYTVLFVDWDANHLSEQYVEYGESAVAPEDPERDGYTFIGWDTDFSIVNKNLYITAQYAEKLWTVTYLNWDGELLGTEEVKDGEAAKGMVATKVGWIFDYWYNTKNFEEEDLKSIKKDLTVKAQFTYEVTFTVTYRVEGVTTFEIQAVYGFDVSKIYYNPKDLPKVPQKESDAMYDYTFAGWTPEVEYLTNNVVLEAVFESTLRKYTVSFYDWDDKLIETQEVEYGKDANAPTPERTGYTFNGWDKRIDDVTENLSVKAQYDINIYSVTFVDWDGVALSTVQMVEYGHAAVPPSDPIRAGYKFDGWDQDFSSVTSDMKVVATYVKLYVVNFVDWDGTILSTQNVEAEKDAHAPADPTREGYEFTGWDTDFTHVSSDLTVKAKYEINTYKVVLSADHGKITVTEDVNLDAVPWGTVLHLTAVPDEGYEFVKWTNYNPEKGLEVKSDVNVTASFTIKIFTVRFLDWDGTMLKADQIVEYGKPAIAPTDPTRDGYEFTGWDKEFGNITSNLTVTAQYQIKSFTLTVLSADEQKGTVTGGGVYEYNSQVSITAVPAEGYLFKQWNDGNTDNPRSITVTKDATYTAEFEQKQPEEKNFTITVVSGNETMGAVLGGGTYKEGSEVQIVAVPKDGYKFSQWNDGNTDNPRTVTVTKDETYTATFAEAVAPHTTYNITVLSADESMGSVMGGGTYDEGSTIFIAALANDGYKFLKWQDGNTDNPRSVTVTKDEIFVASFEKLQDKKTYTLTLVALPAEGGTVIGAGTYEEGATAVVAASPTDGWEFFGWSDGVQDQARQIVMDKDVVLIANFHKIGEGLEAVSSQQSAVSRKVLIDGHVYIILPDGTTYDTNGKVVK